MKHKPRYKKKPEFFEPVKVFFAILIVALFLFAPVFKPVQLPQKTSNKSDRPQPYLGALQVASAQEGCGACQQIGCVEYIWNGADAENGDTTTCTKVGCVAIPACVPNPPTASISVSCDVPGQSGWCRGNAGAVITVTNSQGQNFIISGDVNGNTFACPGGQSTCSVSLPEGTGTVTYVINTDAGFSTTGSATYQVDATTPQLDWNISGSAGTSGWYITQPVASASASDALSGIAALEASMDGGAYANYQSQIPITDGTHTIQFRATDNAGNVTETVMQEIKVDTVAPSLNVSTTGATGQNGWYLSSVALTPTADDSGSGLAALEAMVDGSSWSIVNGPLSFADGIHTVQFRATDNAGNVSQTPAQQIKVDTITPSLSLSTNGTVGLNGWYQSNVSVTPTVSDAGSGVDTIEALIDNGSWSIVNAPSLFNDGIHTYQYKVTDQAGNITVTPTLTVKVDTVAPTLTAPTSFNVLETLHYELLDSTSGLNQFSITISDKDNLQPSAGSAWSLTGNSSEGDFRWSATFGNDVVAGVGWHPLGLRLMDMAGNETVLTGSIEVTRANLRYMELVGPNHQQVNPPNNSTGTIVYAPAATIPTTNQTQPTPDPSFGGENNPAPTEEDTTTTITQGETKTFEGMSVQASFTSGNQTTTTPLTNSNVLWGAAAAAILGATLAEWQKKREEEAALLAAMRNSGGGGGDEEEEASDVSARRRAKVMAKNEAKRAQERVWEAARVQQQAQQQAKIAKAKVADVTEDERFKLYQAEQREAALQAQRAGERNAEQIVEDYESRQLEAYHAGERNAVQIAEEYKARQRELATQAYHDGERNAEKIAEEYKAKQETEKNISWWGKVWNDAKTFWNEKIYTPLIMPFIDWVQTAVQLVKETWEGIKQRVQNVWNATKTVFQEHPAVSLGTAVGVTLATAGTAYYINCYGMPSFMPPAASVANFAGMFSLPLTGWLTTSKKQRVYGILVGMLMLGMLLSACGGGATTTPVAPPTGNALCPEPNTPVPTETMTPPPPTVTADVHTQLLTSNLPETSAMSFMSGWIDEYDLANPAGIIKTNAFKKWLQENGIDPNSLTEDQKKFYASQMYDYWLSSRPEFNSYVNSDSETKAILFWQNYYNDEIAAQAQIYGIDPLLLKYQMLVESNGAPDPGKPCDSNPNIYCRNPNYVGLMQLSGPAINDALKQGNHEDLLRNIYEAYRHAFGPNSIEKPDGMSFQDYYNNNLVNNTQFSDFATRFVDGQCYSSDLGCVENEVADQDGFDAIELAVSYNTFNRDYLIGRIGGSEQWNQFSPEDQNRIMIAAYNGGAEGLSPAILAALANSSSPTWDDVANIIEGSKSPSNWCQVVIYPANAYCYASGGGISCMQYPNTDGNGNCK